MLCQLSYCPLLALGGAASRRCLRPSLTLAPLRSRFVGRSVPLAPRGSRASSAVRVSTVTTDSRLTTADYFVSLCAVCLRQKRQNLLNSSRSVVFFLFLVVL